MHSFKVTLTESYFDSGTIEMLETLGFEFEFHEPYGQYYVKNSSLQPVLTFATLDEMLDYIKQFSNGCTIHDSSMNPDEPDYYLTIEGC